MAKREYTVILADLVQSRAVQERRRAKRRIDNVLRSVSRHFINRAGSDLFIVAPVLTRGMDEMSAVLSSPSGSFEVCRHINFQLFPLKFRFALVRDAIDIGLKTGDASKMDGPAFHRAARGIEHLRKTDETYFFGFHGEQGYDLWMNRISNLAQAIVDKWSHRQTEAVILLEELGKQRDVADHLGISAQAVSERVRAADWNQVRSAFELVDRHLIELT